LKRIKFGTSGWRAIISEDFTFTNTRLVVQAIADYIKTEHRRPKTEHRIIVGYDTRFLSKEFAREAAIVLSSNKIRVFLCDRDTPTPAIAYHIIRKGCAGGINFTASHNPPHYNGIKFSSQIGGPAALNITRNIERNIEKLQKRKKLKAYMPNEKLITLFDPRPAYLRQVKGIVDLKAIKRAKLKIACDCLYGTSRNYLDYILKEQGCRQIVLHDYLNPYFGGRRPEPAEENIKELISVVKKNRLNLGLATDGDADRFGIIDSDGTYITPNQVITLLFYHLLKSRKQKRTGFAARTVATTHMIDIIAKAHGIKIKETPVGFKYFVESIQSGNCIIAGEESGGLSISGHVPEKDGILACLLVAEMVAKEKRPIAKILNSIYKEYGRLYSHRIDIDLPNEKKLLLMKRLVSGSVKRLGRLKVVELDTRDGCRFFLEDGSWVLFRPSGTEPVVRAYFESKSSRTLKSIEQSCSNLMSSIR
jgi:alpha-D-glucose phosphate-specific phosphoglucomutase